MSQPNRMAVPRRSAAPAAATFFVVASTCGRAARALWTETASQTMLLYVLLIDHLAVRSIQRATRACARRPPPAANRSTRTDRKLAPSHSMSAEATQRPTG